MEMIRFNDVKVLGYVGKLQQDVVIPINNIECVNLEELTVDYDGGLITLNEEQMTQLVSYLEQTGYINITIQ